MAKYQFDPKELAVMRVLVLKVGRDVMTHTELRNAHHSEYGKVAAPVFITKDPHCKLVFHRREIRGCYYLPVLEIHGLMTESESIKIRMARQTFMETVALQKEERAHAA